MVNIGKDYQVVEIFSLGFNTQPVKFFITVTLILTITDVFLLSPWSKPAQRIEQAAFDYHSQLLAAAKSAHAMDALAKADIALEQLNIYIRLAMDLKCISFKKYEELSACITESGRLLGGWIKSDYGAG